MIEALPRNTSPVLAFDRIAIEIDPRQGDIIDSPSRDGERARYVRGSVDRRIEGPGWPRSAAGAVDSRR